MRNGLIVTLVFGFIVSSTLFAVQPRSVDLDARQKWVAAKFEEQTATPKEQPFGIKVLDNHNSVERNSSHEGAMIRLGNKTFARGIYTHANSHLIVRLPGPGKTFSATFGVDNNHSTSGRRGSARFHVLVGDKEIFTSDIMRGGDEGIAISLVLDGATEFVLKVDDAGDGISCDQSEWADAMVTLADGTKLMLDEMLIDDPRYAVELTTEPPFSFVYDGKPSSSFLKTWKRTIVTQPISDAKTQRTVTYTDPVTGLEVRCVSVEYAEFPTVEWTLHFKNGGDKDTPIIENIRALDTVFPRKGSPDMKLHYAIGSPSAPEDYRPLEEIVRPGDERRVATSGGRGSDAHLPYLNMETGAREGVIVVVGWPGQWNSLFQNVRDAGLRVSAGQESTRFKLLPGEEVRTPLMVVQFWSGDHRDSQNVWRQWMFAHNIYSPDGKPESVMTTHACTSDFYWEMVHADAASQMFFIDGYVKEKIPIDYWWMDAGWYPCNDEWWQTGTWEPDPARFPKGLREVSDHAAQYGIKTLVWFEPERVHSGSWLAENHPEWLLPGDSNSLLNFGNPEAWDWAVNHFDRLIKEQRIGYYRQDFNMPPLDYWRRNDAEDRQGITEIRHVEGYLAYWDALRRRNPGLLIDTCASGGRRNDLETLRRAIPLHRSDYHRDPNANQAQTYGIAQWMPFFGIGGGGDSYILRSTVAPCNTFGVDMRIENQNLDFMREHLALRDRIKKFYLGDFYPLSAWSLDLSLWMAWQYDLPQEGQGMVQVFRRDQSEYETAVYQLHGLNPEATYRIEDADVGEIGVFMGQELTERGFRVTIPEKRTAKVFIYTIARPID